MDYKEKSYQENAPDKETIIRVCKLHKAWLILAPWEPIEDFITNNWNAKKHSLIMDYEKAYKDALERTRERYRKSIEQGWTYDKEIYEQIFPELRESEDEKIIRTLKEIVNWGCAKNISVENNVELKDCLAWLEKQGEQKPIIITPQFKVGDIIKPKPYNEEHLIKDINENGYVLDVDIIIPFKDEDVWEIVEQKPAELSNGEDFGIDGMYAALDILQKTLGKVDGYQSDDGILEHKCAINAIKKLYEQKADWSEEDESNLNGILDCYKLMDIKWRNWLKSIKPRWKPSEVKSETKNKCPNYSEGYGCSTSPLKQCDTCPDYKLYNHWNPSEEQIKYLEEILNYLWETKNNELLVEGYGYLCKLLKELKTLRDYE